MQFSIFRNQTILSLELYQCAGRNGGNMSEEQTVSPLKVHFKRCIQCQTSLVFHTLNVRVFIPQEPDRHAEGGGGGEKPRPPPPSSKALLLQLLPSCCLATKHYSARPVIDHRRARLPTIPCRLWKLCSPTLPLPAPTLVRFDYLSKGSSHAMTLWSTSGSNERGLCGLRATSGCTLGLNCTQHLLQLCVFMQQMPWICISIHTIGRPTRLEHNSGSTKTVLFTQQCFLEATSLKSTGRTGGSV